MKSKAKRERLILGAVLGIALMGLVFDRYVLPADSEAATDSTEVPIAPSQGLSDTAKSNETPEARLAGRLTEIVGTKTDNVRDLFASSTNPVSASAPAQSTANWDHHQLTAVLLGPNGKSSVIIDGQLIRVGSTLDGLTLVSVTQQSATFSDGSVKVIVPLTKIPSRN